MKITKLRTQVVRVPITPPIVTTLFPTIETADCILTFLETDAGLVGEGLVFTINGHRLKVLHEMVDSLAPLVEGLDPTMGGSLNARAWKELNFVGYEGVSVVGLAAVDMALWDLRAKAADLNVAHLIGACRPSMPVYASGGLWLGTSIDALQREARALVDRGFRAVKTRVGPTDPVAMVARVRAVRERMAARDLPQAMRLFLKYRLALPRGARFARPMFRELSVLREGVLDRFADFLALYRDALQWLPEEEKARLRFGDAAPSDAAVAFRAAFGHGDLLQ